MEPSNQNRNNFIKLSLINGNVFVFNANDYFRLRTEHRITGKLIGIPVSHPRNLLISGLPAVLNELEVNVLLEERLATIEDKTRLRDMPSKEIKAEYVEYRTFVENEIKMPLIEHKLKETKLKMACIMKGKAEKLAKSGVSENEIVITPEQVLKDEEKRLLQSFSKNNIPVQIPTEHHFKIPASTVLDVSISDVKKYKVFYDLWKKGYYISNGESFGCDFLAYPGDPLYYHASLIVHVVEKQKRYDTSFLISTARLSVTVHKKCTFAYVDTDETICYETLEWDNPKLNLLYATVKTKADIVDDAHQDH